MSMKDAIFGTAAPTSHGGATYRDSIQAWLPVKNIIGGVLITKDNRFIKILEVLPVNFYLKSPSDQQNIITSYAAYLKIAPDSMSCEVRTLPPDTSEYVEQMRQYQKTEESENCRAEIAGGALRADASTTLLSSGTIRNNTSGKTGGAIYSSKGDLTFAGGIVKTLG